MPAAVDEGYILGTRIARLSCWASSGWPVASQGRVCIGKPKQMVQIRRRRSDAKAGRKAAPTDSDFVQAPGKLLASKILVDRVYSRRADPPLGSSKYEEYHPWPGRPVDGRRGARSSGMLQLAHNLHAGRRRQCAVTVCSGGASERRLGKVSGDWPLTRLPPHLTRMNREEFSSAAAVHSMSKMHALLQCSAGAVQGWGLRSAQCIRGMISARFAQ